MMVYSSSSKHLHGPNPPPSLIIHQHQASVNSQAMQGGAIKQRKAGYHREFDIERSWIPTNKDITESMLSYSKRMSDKNKERGMYKDGGQKIELPLLIKATHLPNPSRANIRSQERRRTNNKLHGGQSVRAKSLPNMRLEPLLGKRDNFKLNTASLLDLKSLSAVHLKSLKAKILAPLPVPSGLNTDKIKTAYANRFEHDSSTSEEAPVSQFDDRQGGDDSNSMKVVVNTVDTQLTATMDKDNQITHSSVPIQTESDNSRQHHPSQLPRPTAKTSIRSLGRPRRTKRMKLHKSQLESIDEGPDSSDELMKRSHSRTSIPKSFSPIASSSDTSSFQDNQLTIEDRKRDVAMLRMLSNSTNSSRTTSQITMQSLARKKQRKLPPLHTASDEIDKSH